MLWTRLSKIIESNWESEPSYHSYKAQTVNDSNLHSRSFPQEKWELIANLNSNTNVITKAIISLQDEIDLDKCYVK